MPKVRPIDANAFLERVLPECKYPEILKEAVEKQPTIEPEVRHGRWVVEDDCEHFIARCSKCGRTEDSRMIAEMPYCHCGAKMYQTGGTISKERFAEIGGADNG